MLIKLIIKRLAIGALLLLAVSLLIFFGTEILPGDLAQSLLGRSATPEALENIRNELGLNRPMLVRYFEWLFNFVRGDLGTSLANGMDIKEALSTRFFNTLFLATYAAVIAVPLAVFLGLIAVLYRKSIIDKLISGATLAFISLPEFFIGYILIYFFAIKFQWFSSVATINVDMGFFEKLNLLFLPAVTLTMVVLAHMMRMTRAAILNVMQAAYIETAELKGLSRFKIIVRHAFPNSIAPVINVIMINLAYLIVGVVVIEVIFVYPGMGQYLVDHVVKRDLPVVQACGLIFASIYILLNIVADVVSLASNPRLRHPR